MHTQEKKQTQPLWCIYISQGMSYIVSNIINEIGPLLCPADVQGSTVPYS